MNEANEADIIPFATSKEAYSALLQIVQKSGEHQIEIFSHHLDPRLFDQRELYDQISRVARSGRRAMIRLLLQDTDFLCHNDHRLLHLQKRLSSYIQIKRVHQEWQDMNQNFLLADQHGLFYLAQSHRYEGNASLYAPAKVRELRQLFEQIWQRSEVETRLRQLS